jgi:hypothetical protein
MLFVIVQPEMPAAGIPSGIAGDLSPLTATQFATYQPVRAGSYAATDAANWIAIS